MRIGIIEDDRLLNQALEIALRDAGYDTVCARTKKEALSKLDGKEDLLLIDIGLPDGDGVRLYQQLRRESEELQKKRTPAVFLTARDEERDMLAAFDVGGGGLCGQALFHESTAEADRGRPEKEQ